MANTIPPQFQSVPVGANAFAPAYQGQFFPSPVFAKTAPYKFTDPFKFAEQYGAFSRDQISKNFDQARDLALKELDVELAGLQQFVPAAAALKRGETSIDNIFNLQQRRSAVDTALPGVGNQLEGQSRRAESFASGRVPDEITDRALELGIRSDAADLASAGGFGSGSGAARKISDLMSARERIGLSQYGDQLLTGNISTKAGLFLPPTAYSDVGSQIRATPEVGGARLASGALSEINQLSAIPAQAAFSSQIQQQQFRTNQVQQQKNLNAQVENQFNLGKFQYDVGYAGAVAGAAQLDKNTQIALDQQARQEEIFREFYGNAQSAAEKQALASGFTEAITASTGLISALDTAFGGGGEAQTVQDTGAAQEEPSPVPSPSIEDTPGGASSGYTPGGVDLPAGTSVPDGFTGVASLPDGGTVVVPDAQYSAPVTDFNQDIGLKSALLTNPNQEVTKSLLSAGNATMSTAGISQSPQPGYVQAGYSPSGNKMYVSPPLQTSTDSSAGSKFIDTLTGILDPTGALSSEDATTLEQLATVTNDAALMSRLNDLASSGDTKGFVNEVLQATKNPLINNISDDPKDRAGMQAAFSAHSLLQNWDHMSPAQKGLGLAATALQGFKFATGENLAQKQIVKPTIEGGKVVAPGVSVGDALNMFSQGINAYSVIDNWGQLNGVQKIAGGANTAAGIAKTGQQFGLLGKGTNGAEVAITAPQLQAAGFVPAPSKGIGAITGKSGSTIPSGYETIANDGKNVVAIPKGTAQTSAFDVGMGGLQMAAGAAQVVSGIQQGGTSGAINAAGGGAQFAIGAQTASSGAASVSGSLAGQVGGPVALVAGAHSVYKNWGAGGTKGAINGALGGSAMAAGLMAMGATNPFVLGGVVALSMAGGMVKTGKHPDQKARDGVRDHFREIGFMSKEDDTITLPDGTKVNLGIDGSGGKFQGRDAEFLKKYGGDSDSSGTLRPYNTDFSNDMDFVSGMGGVALSRVLTGGKADAIDKMGGQVGNALIANIGHGQDMTPENFSKWQQNSRGVYSQAGIKSKNDAYELVNQGFAEGRWTESEAISMHQAFNMIYDDNGYDTAQKLMSGRNRGLEAAKELPSEEPKQTESVGTSVGAAVTKGASALGSLSKEEVKARNLIRFGQGGLSGSQVDPGFNLSSPMPNITDPSQAPAYMQDFLKGVAA